MGINSLFNVDVFLYNILIKIKFIKKFFCNFKVLKLIKRNKDLLKRNRSDIVYICGNGPSLKDIDLNLIKDDYIVLNDFYRFEGKNIANPPKYYMAIDDSYLDDEYKSRYENIFNSGIDTTFVLDGCFYKKLKKDFPKIAEKSYFICPWKKLFSCKSKNDFTKFVDITWNIVSEAIAFAMYLGYKEIRLLGCDYSVFVNNNHFYEKENVTDFTSDSLQSFLFRYSFTTYVHYELAKYAEKNNIKIINNTKNSLLDAYKIEECEELRRVSNEL